MKQPPRNVKNYRIQQFPDGCWNCDHQYNGMVSAIGNIPILACGLACRTPENPCFCDEVNKFGICDSYQRKKGGSNRTIKVMVT